MRTKGYKCSNVKCGSCVGHSLCGEPADTALGCANRMTNKMTNADRIRAMSDEELAIFLERTQADVAFNNKSKYAFEWGKWLKQPAEE